MMNYSGQFFIACKLFFESTGISFEYFDLMLETGSIGYLDKG